MSTSTAACLNSAVTVPHNMVTTAFTLDGYRIVRNLGLVRGIIVRSRSIVGTIGASLQTLVGGNITLLTNLCEETREHAFDLMLQHAANSARTRSSECATTRRRSCKASPKCWLTGLRFTWRRQA